MREKVEVLGNKYDEKKKQAAAAAVVVVVVAEDEEEAQKKRSSDSHGSCPIVRLTETFDDKINSSRKTSVNKNIMKRRFPINLPNRLL
jgi:hypothetical protein